MNESANGAGSEVLSTAPTRTDAPCRSKDRHRALIEATGQAVWLWSPAGKAADLAGLRQWWEELTGQSIEEQGANNEAWLAFVHPDDRAAAAKSWAAVATAIAKYDTEYRVRGRRGDWRHVRARMVPVPSLDGSFQEWIGTLVDVTAESNAAAERERLLAEVEAERRQLEEAYETVLSHTADFVYLFDKGGRFTYVNKALLDLWGKELSQAIGRNFFDLDYPPDLAARLQRQIQEVIETGRPLRDETPYTSSLGTAAYEYIFVPVFGADSAVEAVAGSTRDITDRKRVEEALRESERRHRALVTATSDVVYRMSADWLLMQPLDGRDFLVSTVQPIRGWMHQNLPLFEHARARDAINKAIALKQTFELEHQVIRVDGTLGWTFSRAIPILDDDGKIVEWFGAASDITRRKRAEEELWDIRSRMEAALDAGAIGTWSWDVLADRFYGDASLASIFSLNSADVAGGSLSRILEAIHPEDRGRVKGLIDQTMNAGDHYEADYRVAQPDGSWKWVTARGKVERGANGRAIRFPGVVIDVTDWKSIEEDLARVTEESERRKRLYEAFLSSTPDLGTAKK